MKVATINNGTRDGCLFVVDKGLNFAVEARDIAATLQQALDNWEDVEVSLLKLSETLNQGQAKGAVPFNELSVAAPLPRAYQWVDGSAYVTHVELVRKARGAEMPASFWTDPLMYQGGSDILLGARDPIIVADESWGIDFEAEIVVITDDVAMGVSASEALSHIKLLALVNDVSLRNLIPGELAKGFGFYQSKPASSFSPVAITPDELGQAWQGGRVHLPLCSTLNGTAFGAPEAGTDMIFSFPDLIAHAAKTRFLGAGTIVGSGTVANADSTKGSSCIAERRMREIIETGQAKTDFMKFGDQIRIEMLTRQGESVFGAIDQKVNQYHPEK
ncbi:fumarylacetoacetate hydrolase family protein [Candidatus Paracaedibacter symbiosus]|uniref:fumarylacetoacetate hydrolase family protein n=1 Tax=Candidatus Paracaedibacter symbiosus TaxID=244582 RepID=UPI0005095A5C|nr:fumarylacetoacetate hydrolase family protein [Candidatus Paracaedibacter symbiosus]